MRYLTLLLLLVLTASVQAQSLSDAFRQGSDFGQSGNTNARSGIANGTPQTIVPGYSATPPETAYFGHPGLGPAATTKIGDCTATPGNGNADPGCTAVDFSQTNPGKRLN